jgi:tRNA-modifying protein YgfZ
MRTAMTQFHFSPQVRKDRAVIAIRGDGALSFLHNLLTCDVAELAVGHAAYGALLSPQGKILHDIFVYNSGETVLIDVAADQRAALKQKLMLYKLRAKLDIMARDDLEIAVCDDGYLDPRNAKLGKRFFAAAGRFQLGDGYDAARIALGLADSVLDIGTNLLFPHEANFDKFDGVSFTKGCFVGQEVVSRMQHRGTARSRIMRISCGAIAPAKGSEIRSGDILIGEVLSSVGTQALALIRADRLVEAKAPLLSGAISIEVQS